MTTGKSIRAATLAILVVASWTAASGAPAEEAPMRAIQVAASDFGSRTLVLSVGKSVVIDFPRDIKDVLVADPKTANAVVRSSRRAYIIGIADGTTNIFFFDAAGRQIAGFDIKVGMRSKNRDVSSIQRAIEQFIPGSQVEVHSVGDGIILTGNVASQVEAQQAYDIASHFVSPGDSYSGPGDAYSGSGNGGGGNGGGGNGGSGGGGSSQSLNVLPSVGLPSQQHLNGASASKIVNLIVVRGRDQVMLKVTVAEVERDLIKQLGINLSGSLGYGTAVVNFNNTNPFTAYGQSLSGSSIGGTWQSITGTLQAMEQAGVVRTLAEPSLTAISGETATFVAGGEFPVLNGFSCSSVGTGSVSTCQPSIDFKKFGVSLNFTPVVLSEGRISLKVMTEVSDLSSQNSLTIAIPGVTAGTAGSTATIPSIRTRRADTTVEIPSGGSLAMAGMIQQETRHNINGFPGLMELPILGPLFKSNDFLNQQTELMILVTPYIVRAVAQKDLSRPDDGFADPSDPAQVLLGRFNRIYGVGGTPDPPDNYRGKYGFILD